MTIQVYESGVFHSDGEQFDARWLEDAIATVDRHVKSATKMGREQSGMIMQGRKILYSNAHVPKAS